MTSLQKILIARHYLMEEPVTNDYDKVKVAYLNAYLLSNFGIVVDQPQKLTEGLVNQIADVFKLNIPKSFYANPQDTKYFTKAELFIEQLVSYFLVETGTGIYDRVEIFEKDLPEYKVGNEIKLREFKIVNVEQADIVLHQIFDAYCDYTRPFGLDELEEFEYLFARGYYTEGKEIKCRDNIFTLLKHNVEFARFLDKKDMVKLSVGFFGEKEKLNINSKDENLDLIRRCLPYVRNCPMSKKQAKYFNKLVSLTGAKAGIATNERSPYKLAKAELDNGNVLGAAKVYARNGSLLERNIKFLLSRANPMEAVEIINMLPAKNPIALYQMVNTLSSDDGNRRTFTFTKNNRVKKHTETDYEAKWRKSKLNDSTRKLLHDVCMNKVKEYYASLGSLGNVYVADNFYKLGIPSNTSAGGKGIDVIPTGSRIRIPYNKIRTFVYWKDVFDIDASLTLVGEHSTNKIYFGNYSSKPFGTSILFSGDNRNSTGAEYYDIKLDELRAMGYKYVLYHINGFGGDLNKGDIFCGYQNKEDFNTRAWDPKNIEVQFRVKGDSRNALTFAIDLTTNEMVVLNLVGDQDNRVANSNDTSMIAKYLDASFLELNMGLVASSRGTVVDDPALADVVFDDTYQALEGQKVIRSYELEKLVSLANGADLA